MQRLAIVKSREMLKVRITVIINLIANMNNYFNHLIEEPVTGLKLMLGTLSIHLVEGEQSSVRKLLRNIN